MPSPAPIARTMLAVVFVAVLVAGAAGAAAAAEQARGPEGQSLTVSNATNLSPAGETVTVTGSGYDQDKGIYVAYCADNGPGVVPTPCGGGADTSGSLGASHWISSNPPSYGEGLAVPYGEGGSFSVTLTVTPTIEDVDCTARPCAVVTRADHTRSADRSQDVRVPVSFATGATDTGGGSRSGGGSTGGDGDNGDDDDGGNGNGNGPPAAGAPPPDGVSVITAGPVPAGAPAPATDQLAVTRASVDDSAGRWWLISTGALLAVLLVLLISGRVASRRRAAGRSAGPASEAAGASR